MRGARSDPFRGAVGLFGLDLCLLLVSRADLSLSRHIPRECILYVAYALYISSLVFKGRIFD